MLTTHKRVRPPKITSRMLGIIFLLGSSVASAEDDVITIEGTRITGSQESPTILYVIPWQAPEVEALEATGTIAKFHNEPERLERSEFKRLIDYHAHFKRVTVNENEE